MEEHPRRRLLAICVRDGALIFMVPCERGLIWKLEFASV
jgi:hypothetical protein